MPGLAEATSPEILRDCVVVVPVGSLEQHGPHLPLDTDTVIATAVATAVADRTGAWCAPAMTYGSSGEHQAFTGTISIGTNALYLCVLELVRSVRTWGEKVIFVNGHGGNIAALDGAVDLLTREGHDVTWIACAAPGMDAHAGRAETSLMLHLRPGSVRLDRAQRGNSESLARLLPDLKAGGVASVSPNGVLGDPFNASAEEGAQLLATMVQRVSP